MEHGFGHDFSQVRIHTDAHAAQAASTVAARAFTVNHDIVFGVGEYAPQTESGRRLLSHELTHVVQQQAGVHLKNGVGQAGDAYETHADAVADLVVNGKQAGPLLDQVPGSAGGHVEGMAGAGIMLTAGQPVQMQPQWEPPKKSTWVPEPLSLSTRTIFANQKEFEDFNLMYEMRPRIASALAHEYWSHKHPEPKVSREGKQTSNEYKWDPGGTAPADATLAPGLAVGTYSGGYSSVPVQPLDEKRVYEAIYRSLVKIKRGKGDKLEDWVQKDVPDNLRVEQEIEVAKWGAKEATAKVAEEFAKKKIKNEATLKVAEISIKLLGKDILGTVGLVLGSEIIGALAIAWSVGELLYSLAELDQLTGEQAVDARIFADVRAYFLGKEQAEEDRKRLSQPFRFANPILKPDKATVVPRH